MPNGFLLYTNYEEFIKGLDDEAVAALTRAIFAYAARREQIDVPDRVKPILGFIRVMLDQDFERWEHKSAARQEAGRQGGLAKASKAKQKLANEANASKSYQNIANQAININSNINTNSNSNTPNGGGRTAYKPIPGERYMQQDYTDEQLNGCIKVLNGGKDDE